MGFKERIKQIGVTLKQSVNKDKLLLLIAFVLCCFSSMHSYETGARLNEEKLRSDTLKAEAVKLNNEIFSLRGDIALLKNQVRESAKTRAILRDEKDELKRKVENKLTPFNPMPLMTLTKEQNIACLAIAVQREARGEGHYSIWLDNAWAIVARAIDGRKDAIYSSNICSVVSAKNNKGVLQYSPMGPYLNVIENIVWGRLTDIEQYKMGGDEEDQAAWVEIKKMAKDIVEGKLPRTTTANHFISFYSMSKSATIPDFVRYLCTVGGAGRHTLLRDYTWDADGNKVIFTKEKPYNPRVHGACSD